MTYSYLETGVYDYANHINTCICSGTKDPAYELTQMYRDSLALFGTNYYYNEIMDIGHTYDFIGFKVEIIECINWFDGIIASFNNSSINTISGINISYKKNEIGIKSSQVYDNLNIEIISLHGKIIEKNTVTSNYIKLDISSFKSGFYIIRIYNSERSIKIASFVKN